MLDVLINHNLALNQEQLREHRHKLFEKKMGHDAKRHWLVHGTEICGIHLELIGIRKRCDYEIRTALQNDNQFKYQEYKADMEVIDKRLNEVEKQLQLMDVEKTRQRSNELKELVTTAVSTMPGAGWNEIKRAIKGYDTEDIVEEWDHINESGNRCIRWYSDAEKTHKNTSDSTLRNWITKIRKK